MSSRAFAVMIISLLFFACAHPPAPSPCDKPPFRVSGVEVMRGGQPGPTTLGTSDPLRVEDSFALRVDAAAPLWIRIVALTSGTGRVLWPTAELQTPVKGSLRLPLEPGTWLTFGGRRSGRLCVLASGVPIDDPIGLCRKTVSPTELHCAAKKIAPVRSSRDTEVGEEDTSDRDKDKDKGKNKDKAPAKDDPPPSSKGPPERPSHPLGLGVWEKLEKNTTRVLLPTLGPEP